MLATCDIAFCVMSLFCTQIGPEEKHLIRTIQQHRDFPDLMVIFFGPFVPQIVIANPDFKKILLKSAGWCCTLYHN